VVRVLGAGQGRAAAAICITTPAASRKPPVAQGVKRSVVLFVHDFIKKLLRSTNIWLQSRRNSAGGKFVEKGLTGSHYPG
jgi:hypothetical protein